MLKKYLYQSLLLLLLVTAARAQNNLDYYLEKGIKNSPSLRNYQNLQSINSLQKNLNAAQATGFNIYLSADYLFAPYFNNNGQLISANPAPDAIGYDVGITNGGEYSAQLNVEKNIFNGGTLDALNKQTEVSSRQNEFGYDLEKHTLKKQITDSYLTVYQSMLQYNLAEEIVGNLNEQLRITGELVEKGYEKAQNYLLLKVELQNQKISADEAFQKYKSNLLQLNSLCGIKDTQMVKIDSADIKLKSQVGEFQYTEKYRLDSLSAAAGQSVFETKYSPQLKVFMNTGLNAVELDGIQRKFGFSAGLNFSLPIFDGGQKSITRQQTSIAQQTIQDYKNYSLSNLKVQRSNSLSKIKSIQKNIDQLETQINDYRKLIRISAEQLETGGISMIDYLTMLRNFIDLRKMKIEKETSRLMEINNYNYWNW